MNPIKFTISGKGNGIFTIIHNLNDIGKSINHPENLLLKSLIAHDKLDKVVLVSESQKIAKSLKNAEFIETEGLGHSMHNDELYQKITRFVFET